MFVDRRAELDALLRALGGEKPSLVRVYGRRRVGKTELLREAARKTHALFLLADEADRPQQLEALSRQIAEFTHGLRPAIRDWDDLFDHVEGAGTRVVIIDEFQRLLASDRQAASRLQARWDLKWQREGPSVVLCGSSIGMMQRLTGGRRGPLFGRLRADMRLRPFAYPAVRLLYPDADEEERIRRFAVFGGTPYYHALSTGSGLKEAVTASFLEPTAPFREEPQELLRMELKSPPRYNSILYEVGQGTHYLGELESKVGVKRGGLGPYLEALKVDLDLLTMEDPVCGVKRQARYLLSDPFFRFYFRFIFANRPNLELGRAAAVWKQVEANLEGHVGLVFEQAVRDIFVHLNGSTLGGAELDFDRIGRWWNRAGEEIDLVAAGAKEVWAAEISWASKPSGVEAFNGLTRKIRLMERIGGLPVRPVLVARRGFTDEAQSEAAKRGGVLLTLEELAHACDEKPL